MVNEKKLVSILYFLIGIIFLNCISLAMAEKPFHHLPDGTFRNPQGSPERDPNVNWSYKIFNKEKELVGEVTSGSISPYSKKAIGMGYVSYGENTISEKIFIEVRSKKVEAQIVKRQFI